MKKALKYNNIFIYFNLFSVMFGSINNNNNNNIIIIIIIFLKIIIILQFGINVWFLCSGWHNRMLFWVTWISLCMSMIVWSVSVTLISMPAHDKWQWHLFSPLFFFFFFLESTNTLENILLQQCIVFGSNIIIYHIQI